MSNDVLEKVKQLPVDKQEQVEDFIQFLLSKYRTGQDKDAATLAEKRRGIPELASNGYWMADDFNDTPEDFKDYI